MIITIHGNHPSMNLTESIGGDIINIFLHAEISSVIFDNKQQKPACGT